MSLRVSIKLQKSQVNIGDIIKFPPLGKRIVLFFFTLYNIFPIFGLFVASVDTTISVIIKVLLLGKV